METKQCECGCGQLTQPYKNSDSRISAIKGQLKRFATGHNSKTGHNIRTNRDSYNKYSQELRQKIRQDLMSKSDIQNCSTCKFPKFWSEFYDTDNYICKLCKNKQSKEWSHKNKIRRAAINRKCTLKNRYGLSIENFNKILELQNNSCAICKIVNPKTWHVDHDHNTNIVRGILCYTCNVGLGSFNDNIQKLGNAIEYLKRSELNGSRDRTLKFTSTEIQCISENTK